MDRIESHRVFFANLISLTTGIDKQSARVTAAFANVPREHFLGPGPWKIFAGGGYVETPTDDPAFLYQDVVVGLAPERRINNGQPALHAICLAALNITPGENILHIGAGTGYYTALLAYLSGETGSVTAYECESDLAEAAARNLADSRNVQVRARSGSEGPLPESDVIYVSAGATAPLNIWLDALRPKGRLLFPLTPSDGPSGAPGVGAMLLVTRTSEDNDRFDARFVCQAAFIPCVGARDHATAEKLSVAFRRGDFRSVRSFRRNSVPDESAWVASGDWWLSTK